MPAVVGDTGRPGAPPSVPAVRQRARGRSRRRGRLVAQPGEALGLGFALRLALGPPLLLAGLLVLLVVLEADDPDLAAERAVAAERGELLAAGGAVVAGAASVAAP